MNSAYNFNLYIKTTFSGSLEWPLYTGLTVHFSLLNILGLISQILHGTGSESYLRFPWYKFNRTWIHGTLSYIEHGTYFLYNCNLSFAMDYIMAPRFIAEECLNSYNKLTDKITTLGKVSKNLRALIHVRVLGLWSQVNDFNHTCIFLGKRGSFFFFSLR